MHDGSGKFNFEDIYNLADPRGYFETLGELDYRIPEHSRLVFSALIEARLEAAENKRVPVLDLCVLLYERYGSEEVSRPSSDELAESDANFFRERGKESSPSVAGLDVARKAVGYGLKASVLDVGSAENLEEVEPSDGLKETTARGPAGHDRWRELHHRAHLRTPARERRHSGTRPVGGLFRAADPLVYPHLQGPVRSPAGDGEAPRHTFEQRRFATPEEREFALQELAGMGLDPEGKEEAGIHHTDFYLSRPAEETASTPVEELLARVLELESPG